VVNFLNRFKKKKNKYSAEIQFWIKEISNYVNWYSGHLDSHYKTPSPLENQKLKSHNLETSSILTWFELHQKTKYAFDLKLQPDAFSGLKVLDVGSGPMPSGEIFENCELYCLDPLLPDYIKIGFPFHCYREKTRFVYANSEKIPFEDNFFDAVISVNAIDHIDDIFLTAKEINRTLKHCGKLRMHVHYHRKTRTEPIELNDKIMKQAFKWCEGLKKIFESEQKMGAGASHGEVYTLWSNY
jgi:SAM-dependent methyltransferase